MRRHAAARFARGALPLRSAPLAPAALWMLLAGAPASGVRALSAPAAALPAPARALKELSGMSEIKELDAIVKAVSTAPASAGGAVPRATEFAKRLCDIVGSIPGPAGEPFKLGGLLKLLQVSESLGDGHPAFAALQAGCSPLAPSEAGASWERAELCLAVARLVFAVGLTPGATAGDRAAAGAYAQRAVIAGMEALGAGGAPSKPLSSEEEARRAVVLARLASFGVLLEARAAAGPLVVPPALSEGAFGSGSLADLAAGAAGQALDFLSEAEGASPELRPLALGAVVSVHRNQAAAALHRGQQMMVIASPAAGSTAVSAASAVVAAVTSAEEALGKAAAILAAEKQGGGGKLHPDLARHEVAVNTAAAEARLLRGLLEIWAAAASASSTSPAGSEGKDRVTTVTRDSAGVATASVQEAAPTPARRRALEAAVLFPLPAAQNEALTPTLQAASALADAALKAAEALEAQGSTAAPSLDYGADGCAGLAGPLRVIAELQFVTQRAVMAEGLLRTALDRYASVQVGGKTQIIGALAAQKAGALHTLSYLLSQWDKRGPEGERVEAEADGLMVAALLGSTSDGFTVEEAAKQLSGASAFASLEAAGAAGVSSSAGFTPKKWTYVARALVAAAGTAAHVGSWAPALLGGR